MLVLDTKFNVVFNHGIILFVVPQDIGIEIRHVWAIYESLNQINTMRYGHIYGEGFKIFMKLVCEL